MKFPLYDLLGRVKTYFLVEELRQAGTGTATKEVAHLNIVLDASGSMWGVMDALRATTEKLLTLQEYKDSGMLVSLFSFSSKGDIITHVSRTPVSEILKPGSRHIEQIRQLRTRGMTCVSQGLSAALDGVVPGETTAVVVLSDGFANDMSPGSEKRAIDTLVERARKMPGVFVNTIAFGHYADYQLLSYVANACSGTCFQSPSVKEVHDAIHGTANLLTGAMAPAVALPIGQADYQVFASVAARKVIGGAGDLLIRGLGASDDQVVWRFRRVEEAEYNASAEPMCGEDALYAFARTQLAEGAPNTAKCAIVSTRNLTILRTHARALVGSEFAAMAADLESALFKGTAGHDYSDGYGLPNARERSVVAVLGTLAEHASDVEVDLAALRSGYKRRGVKRVAGTRQEDGTVAKPWVKTAFRDAGDWVPVSAFEVNRNSATVNMRVTRPIDLVKADDGTPIREVAGVKLDLKAFNNYTLVGDGVLNVGRLRVRIGNKRLYRALVATGVLADADFDPKATYDIVLEGRPLVAYDATFDADALDGVFERAARLKALSSVLTSSLKEQSDAYTAEQVAELKKHHLSPALYLSLPTTNEYADLKAALTDGIIDTRVSYKVDFGTPDILNLGELYSANEFLARHFTLTRNGTEEKKPKFDMRWDAGVAYGYKTLSGKTKLNPVDDLMKPIFEDFLGLQPNGVIAGILADAGVDVDVAARFLPAARGTTSKDTAVEAFVDARKAVDTALDRIFRDTLSPLVFYVGATGLVPDEFDARAMTAEQAKEKHPNLTIGKAEADGTFYDVGSTVLSVSAVCEYFSTGKVPDTTESEETV